VLEEAEEDESESEWEPDELSFATDDSSDMSVDMEDGLSEESFVGGHSDGVDDVLKCSNCCRCFVDGETSAVFDLGLSLVETESFWF